YSALIQFATFALYLLFSGRLKYASTWKGIAVATLSLVLLVSPHLIWLLTHGGGPLTHAGGEMEPVATYWEELKEIAYFTTNNIARISPMILGLIIVIFAYR